MPYTDDDISFVVQGPVVVNTDSSPGVYSTSEVMDNIRRFFPGAEIVLSTWKGSDINCLCFDKLVLNDDPGAVIVDGIGVNINRLIVSTVNGIKSSTRKYVIKTRTDLLFTSNILLKQLNNIENSRIRNRYQLFKKKVISTNFYVRDPVKWGVLFHPSDILLIGLKNDLLSLFDHKLATETDYRSSPYVEGPNKILNEQYLFTGLIEKKINVHIEFPLYTWFMKKKYFILSEDMIFENFHLCTAPQLGVKLPKRLTDIRQDTVYSARAIKWYPILRSLKVTDILFFKIIRPFEYYRKNKGLATIFKAAISKLSRIKP